MTKKGIISAVLDDGNMATVKPVSGEIVTPALVVPAHLFGIVPVGTHVWYFIGNDNTGLILQRTDGRIVADSSGGGVPNISVHIGDDNVAYIRPNSWEV